MRQQVDDLKVSDCETAIWLPRGRNSTNPVRQPSIYMGQVSVSQRMVALGKEHLVLYHPRHKFVNLSRRDAKNIEGFTPAMLME